MKIFVINLDRSSARMEHMAALLTEHKQEMARVSAVDGRGLSEEERLSWIAAGEVSGKKPYPMVAGEVGCFLSHRKCWELVLRGDDSHAVVFEDDIVIGECHELLSSADWIPGDADVVKLETTRKRTVVGKEPSASVGARAVRRLYDNHNGTAGYVVSREGARKLLDMSHEFAVPVDSFMFDPTCCSSTALTIYQVDPAPCIQSRHLGGGFSEELRSTLRSERLHRSPIGFSKLQRELARPFFQISSLIEIYFENIFRKRKVKIIPYK